MALRVNTLIQVIAVSVIVVFKENLSTWCLFKYLVILIFIKGRCCFFIRGSFIRFSFVFGCLFFLGFLFIFKFNFACKKSTDWKLISHNEMSYLHPNLCLVISHLMPMELRVDSAQLQMKSTLNFQLVDSTRYTFVLKRCVTPGSQLLETGLKTKRTLFKLT